MKARFSVKYFKRIIILFLLMSLTFPSFGAADEDALAHLLNVEMVNYNVPGAMVTIVQDGALYYKNALGEANVTTKTPMDPNLSIVQTGSVSKVMTTYALLELLERKNISVDEAIGKYLPTYLVDNDYIASLTFKNLLTHTTGIATLKANSASQEDPLKSMNLSFSEQAELFFDTYNIKPVVDKDDYTIFSNVGYILSGVLIESISGDRYEYYLAEEVLKPLGMTTSSDILMHRDLIGFELVQNYSVFGGQRTPLSAFNTKYLPSDDFLTTLDDMTLFLEKITSANMSEQMKELMFSRQIANNAFISGKSFGFSVVKYGAYEAYIHDGGIPGSNSRLLVIPEIKLAMFLTYNSNSLKARESITNAVLSDLIVNLDQKTAHEPYLIDDLSKFNGGYSPVNASNETMEQLTRIIHQIRITDVVDGLKIDDELYYPISETIFYNESHGNYAEFRTDEDGQLEYLIVGNSIYERTPFFQSMIIEATMLVLMAIFNGLALLIFVTNWSNMKVNRIHDTPRVVMLIHSLSITGVLVFILIISSSYDIWDVIYGINNAIKGTRFFGLATLVMSFPTFIMISRAKQDYRWSRLKISIYQIQLALGFLLVIWLYIYNLL